MKLRDTVMLGALLLLAAATACQQGEANAEAEADAAMARGRAAVEKTCVGCHAGPKLDEVVARRMDPPGALDGFLAKHHAEDAALRSDVVAYLRSRQASGD